MNLIITINNAQMQTINEAKLIGAQMIIENKLEKSEIKRREEIILCRLSKNPTDQQYEKPNLEQREIFSRFRSWESKRASDS